MRKNALIFIIVVALFSAALYFITQNKYLERATEKSGELIFGARVEIDAMHFSLFDLQCGWDRLQIANKDKPMTNLIETGEANFKLEFTPLFWRKVIITEMRIENVQSGTARQSSGSLPRNKAAKAKKSGVFAKTQNALKEEMHALPALEFAELTRKLNIDSLIQIDKLQSVAGYSLLAQEVDSSSEFFSAKLKNQNYTERINALKKKIDALNIDKNMDILKIQKTLADLGAITKEVDKLQNDIQADKSSAQGSFKSVTEKYDNLKKQVQADISKAKNLARLKELDTRDVGLLLFGAPLIEKIENLLHYLNLARRYFPAAAILLESEKEPEPERFAGQDIYFPFHHKFPDFLIRKILLTGSTGKENSNAYNVSGKIFGLTNQPAVFGEPTKAELEIQKSAGNGYKIRSVLDHVSEIAKDSVWIDAQDFRLGSVKLKENKNLPTELVAEKGDLNFTGFLRDEQMNLNLKVHAEPVQFKYAQSDDNRISKTIREVLDGVRVVEISAQLKTENDDRVLKLSSNIDNVLSQRLKNILDKNVTKARQDVENRVQQEVAANREKADAALAGFKSKVDEEMAVLENRIKAETDKLAAKKKELEVKLAEETGKVQSAAEKEKKKLENEAKKKLDGLFNKNKKDDKKPENDG
ncbi:MAG: TIGR03545 family protein [Calditrichaeota bacterium]|nr:MAG: TIGR03545 family protein [Calditrichota bacterium]